MLEKIAKWIDNFTNLMTTNKADTRTTKQKWTHFAIDALVIWLLPLIVLSIVESLNRQGFGAYLDWTRESMMWLMNYMGLLSVFGLLYLLPRKWFYGSAVFVSIVISLFGYMNMTLIQLKGDPLTPLDLLLAKEAANIVGDFDLVKPIAIVVMLVLLVVGLNVLLLKKMPKTKFQFLPHLFVFTCGVLLFISWYTQEPTRFYNDFQMKNKNVNPLQNTILNGFLMHFTLEMKDMKVDEPPRISQKKLMAKLAEYPQPTDGNTQKPNVIFWMGEAFWDLTESPVLTFSKDPLAFFHKMQAEYTSGNLLVKARGGHTANTEFEVLTGSTMNFLPVGSVPYNQYIHRPIDSLAQVFSANGYNTSAIHPYNSWYYNRNKVYRYMGFDHYASGEFAFEPKLIAGLTSDQTFSDSVLATMKKSPKRDFIYAISMQNHVPYDRVVPDPDYTVAGDITPDQKLFMEKYVRNLRDTDVAFQKLIEGIEQTGEPTIVVLFGDHLPGLKDKLKVGKEARRSLFPDADTQYKQYLKAYQTPFLIWDNIGLEKEKTDMTTSYLGAYVLRKLAIERPAFWNFMYSEYEKHPVFPTSEYYKQVGIKERELTFYKQLQYDRLFGKQVSLETPVKAKKSFFLGFDRQRIKAVTFTKNEGEKKIYQITGQGFSSGGHLRKPTVVNVNGDEVEATVQSMEVITFKVDKETKVRTVQTENLDSKKRSIAKSNVFKNVVEK